MLLNIFSVCFSTILFLALIRRPAESELSLKVHLFANKIAALYQMLLISNISLIKSFQESRSESVVQKKICGLSLQR